MGAVVSGEDRSGRESGLARLAGAVRERRVSARELVALAIDRIERLDPALGSVVALRPDEALAEAQALDERIARGDDPGPLVGLPLLVKDSEHLKGMPTTSGSVLRRDAPPEPRDSLVPRRLKAAGAVAVGKTNVPEFTFAPFTANRLFGPTRNPWNPDWSPGGSSGGSGAALAAGLAPIATATDGGGSVRIPASLCGLAGLKPTNGLIPRDPVPEWIDLLTSGPMASGIEDVRLLLTLTAGPASGDPVVSPFPPPWRAELPSRALAAPRTVPSGPLPASVNEAFRAALEQIERDVGLPVGPIDPRALFGDRDPSEDWFTLCGFEHLHFLGADRVREALDELTEPFRARMEAAMRISPATYVAARRQRFEYTRRVDEVLGEDAVLLTPTLGVEGWLADGTVPSTGRPARGPHVQNVELFNLTGHPVLSVPAGRLPNGLPFGLQVTGPRFRDPLPLAVGRAYEQAHPWPPTAPGYEPFEVP